MKPLKQEKTEKCLYTSENQTNLVVEWSISAGTSHTNTVSFLLPSCLSHFEISKNSLVFEWPFKKPDHFVQLVPFYSYITGHLNTGFEKMSSSSNVPDFGFQYSDVDIFIH
jgi:hypothetical protein